MSAPLKNFYIDIASAFDLRAGCIERLKPGHVTELVRNGYHNRKSDIFPGIDMDAYRELYWKFEDDTLTASYATNVYYSLLVHVIDVLREAKANEVHPDHLPKLYLNIYPYEFDDDAKLMLRQVCYSAVQRLVDVVIISRPMEDLDPAWMRETFFLAYMYHYDKWYSHHMPTLSAMIAGGRRITDLIILGPMVFINNDPDSNEEIQEHLRNGINPLALVEAGLEGMGLRLQNPEIFSIVYPDDRIVGYSAPESTGELTLEEYSRIVENQRQQEG